MGQLTQESRQVAISDFSLGTDTFLVKRLSGKESVSGLFEFHVTLVSEKLDIKANDVMGKLGHVALKSTNGREFSGHIARFVSGEVQENNLRTYEVVLRPWLAFLAHRVNNRIFQNKTTKDIVSQIFSEQGLQDFEFRAQSGDTREYCVQRNESDLQFVCRLLEEDGISYFFEHVGGKHNLILVDQANAFPALEDNQFEYSPGSNPGARIHRWQHSYNYRAGQWTLSDYDFNEPIKSLLNNSQGQPGFAYNGQFEHYEYPAFYHTGDNAPVPRMRMQAEELDRNVVAGSSDYPQLVAGGKFNLAKHESNAEKGAYILLEVHHEVVEDTQTTGDGQAQCYTNDFICVPADTAIRPKRAHQRPVMKGPETAWVVGPEGEEIYIDELGRIKVQFHWDREGERDEKSSCFLRVAQSWAGNQWGSSFIPRIGQEVVVDFLNGDPDRPLVTGAVYNSKNRPVYTSKTQSGIKTRSTQKGTVENYNELRFEDKKGAEQILLHAEKDYDVEVENNQTLTIDNDRTKTVRNDETSLIENDRTKTVNNNQSETIGKDKSIEVGENHRETIGGSKQVEVKKDHTETIGNNMVISVKNNLTESVEGEYRESVTNQYGLSAKSINLQADDEITLKTGSAMIQLKSNGDITISGANINVKGSGNVVLKGSKVTSN
ncbi:type VI secretion system tip protein TssI/VgrG [Marinimicrobium sp. C6131]|uniref:type VI secretion system Vgr family protein n=1 Tax=Marinimicrobium sp. C6131 TaxID=3022676 RepID=UPI00223E7864|nr:type VI secretion system tip protein TssI/VgrG [Marinimicrobium sp. C6131]UZJ44277.1 type VI secretion system tip protein TssI/VgrG [Marinimicrobium sp. C6131]